MADAFASDFDETDVFDDTSLSLAQDSFAVEGSARPTGLTLTEAGSFEDADLALAGLSDFVKQQQGQGRALGLAAVESGDYSGIKNKDINKLRRDDKNVTDYYTESVDNNIIDFVNDNNIPLYKDVNGQRVYLNTGTEGSLAGIAKEGSEVTYQTYGPVGTYSSIAVPDGGMFDFVNPYLRAALAAFTGGASEAIMSATAGLAGETLKTEDWLNLAQGAYQLSQLKTPVTPTGAEGTGPSGTLEEMAQDPNSGVMSATGVGGATDAVDTASTVASRSTAIGDAAVNAAFDSGKLTSLSTAADAQSVADAAINTYRNSAAYLIDLAKDNAGLLTDIGIEVGSTVISSLGGDDELVPSGLLTGGSTVPQDIGVGNLDKEGIENEFEFDPEIKPPTLPEETKDPAEAAASAAQAAASAAEAAGASAAASSAAAQAAYDAVMGGADAAAAAEVGAQAAADFKDEDGEDKFDDDNRAEGESFGYDKDAFFDSFGDFWLEADFNTLDANNDGIVTAEEMDEYERSKEVVEVKDCPTGFIRDATGACVLIKIDEVEVEDPVECPTGFVKNAEGVCVPEEVAKVPEVVDPVECPTGQERNSEGFCVAITKNPVVSECPVGFAKNSEGVCVPEEVVGPVDGKCPVGQEKNAEGVCVAITDGTGDCPAGQSKNAEGVCVTDGTGECQEGQSKNAEGVCVDDGNGNGNGNGDGNGDGNGSGGGSGGGSGIGYRGGSQTESLFADFLKLQKPQDTQELLQYAQQAPEQGMMSPSARNDILLEFIQANPNAGMLANLQRNRR